MYDGKLVLQAQTTLAVGTATTINSTALDLLNTPQGVETFVGRVTFPGAQIATTAAVATFSISESSDNTTFYQCSRPQFVTYAAATVSTNQPLFLPFVRSQRYVRLDMVLSNSTSGLTQIYKGELGLARP